MYSGISKSPFGSCFLPVPFSQVPPNSGRNPAECTTKYILCWYFIHAWCQASLGPIMICHLFNKAHAKWPQGHGLTKCFSVRMSTCLLFAELSLINKCHTYPFVVIFFDVPFHEQKWHNTSSEESIIALLWLLAHLLHPDLCLTRLHDLLFCIRYCTISGISSVPQHHCGTSFKWNLAWMCIVIVHRMTIAGNP